jgi:hypothetical protein
LKRRKTWKCSRRPKTGWEQPTESAEGLSLATLFVCARGIAIDARGAPENGMRKFSCLQSIEKAQNAKIYSGGRGRAGSNQPDGGGSLIVAVFASARSGASFDREAGDRDLT